MNRFLTPALAVIGLTATLAIAGCDSGTSTTPATTGAADASSSTDSTVSDSAAKSDTATGGGDTSTTKPDTATGGGDTATADVPKPPMGCDPACKAGEFCDMKATPPKCTAMACALPTKWGPTIQKASKLELPAGTVGCDLNGDGKVDNALGTGLSMLLGQANDALKKSVGEGKIVILMETAAYKDDGSAFSLNMLVGDMDASNATCDSTSATANCKYTVSDKSYDPTSKATTCPALINFPDAKVTTGKLTGGGKDQKFFLNIPVAGINLSLAISQAQAKGDVTGKGSWDSTAAGLICGILTKKDLEAAINAVPDEQFKALGLGKADALAMIGGFITPDFSSTGGSEMDAYSVAISWESVKGQITGMTPPPKN